MKSAMPTLTTSVAPKARIPWFALILVTTVFALTVHKWGFSVKHIGLPAEWRSEVVASGNILRRVCFSVLGLYGLASLFRHSRKLQPGTLAWLTIGLVVLTSVSVLWADDLGFSLRRWASFVLFCIGALGLAARLKPRDITVLVFASTGLYLLLGIASEVAHGTYLFSPRSTWYRFAGTCHPNVQGINCALLALSGVVLGNGRVRWKNYLFYAVAMAGFSFLVLTRSRTSFAAFIVALVAVKVSQSGSSRRIQALFVAATVFVSFFLVVGQQAVPLLRDGALLGRGEDEGTEGLVGRVPLWSECIGYAMDRPLLGYGFNGFWTPERIQALTDSRGWMLGSGHSIYIDVMLDLGLIGAGLFLTVVGAAILRAYSLLRRDDSGNLGFLFGFLVFFSAHGLLESIFISPGYPAFINMVVLSKLGFFDLESTVQA
jgi:O-antigen ligase